MKSQAMQIIHSLSHFVLLEHVSSAAYLRLTAGTLTDFGKIYKRKYTSCFSSLTIITFCTSLAHSDSKTMCYVACGSKSYAAQSNSIIHRIIGPHILTVTTWTMQILNLNLQISQVPHRI